MSTENVPLNQVGVVASEEKITEQQKQIFKWQNKLLPWMIALPSILILLFLYLANSQVKQFNMALAVIEESSITKFLEKDSAQFDLLKKDMDYVKWMTLVKMEEQGVSKRYHQGGLLLLSRIFIKYLGFLTGMILAIVGSVFIISKLSEDQTTLEGSSGEKIKFSLASSSPGIFFGILGTALMMSCIWQHNEVSIQEQPMFLNAANINVIKPGAIKRTVNPVKISQLDTSDTN